MPAIVCSIGRAYYSCAKPHLSRGTATPRFLYLLGRKQKHNRRVVPVVVGQVLTRLSETDPVPKIHGVYPPWRGCPGFAACLPQAGLNLGLEFDVRLCA
jgi:hypothetical protein